MGAPRDRSPSRRGGGWRRWGESGVAAGGDVGLIVAPRRATALR